MKGVCDKALLTSQIAHAAFLLLCTQTTASVVQADHFERSVVAFRDAAASLVAFRAQLVGACERVEGDVVVIFLVCIRVVSAWCQLRSWCQQRRGAAAVRSLLNIGRAISTICY